MISVAGCQCEPTYYASRPLVFDAGLPDYLDEPCMVQGSWVLTHTGPVVSERCLPPDGVVVDVDSDGCSVAMPATLPAAFVSTVFPKSRARCRKDPKDECLIALTVSATTYGDSVKATDALELTIRLRQLGDGTFFGTTSMRLDSCSGEATLKWRTVAAP